MTDSSVKPNNWKHIKPPPGEKPSMFSNQLGNPTDVWHYKDIDGSTIGYSAMYEGKEEPYCWTYGTYSENVKPRWGMHFFSPPMPLYGLDRLANKQDGQIILCVTENEADALQQIMESFCCLALPPYWYGNIDIDWSPVAGRNAVLWPANTPLSERKLKLAARYLMAL